MTRAEAAGMSVGALAGALLLAWTWPPGALLTMALTAKTIGAIAAGILAGWLAGRWLSRRRDAG